MCIWYGVCVCIVYLSVLSGEGQVCVWYGINICGECVICCMWYVCMFYDVYVYGVSFIHVCLMWE